MTEFLIKKLPYDLGSQAGLALIGKYFRRININAMVDTAFPIRLDAASNSTIHLRTVRLTLRPVSPWAVVSDAWSNLTVPCWQSMSCINSKRIWPAQPHRPLVTKRLAAMTHVRVAVA